MLNSQFLHQAASFQSVFRVWSEMHPEVLQQHLLCGAFGTLERNNCQRLEDAWFAWSATSWAGGLDVDVEWDFEPDEFDRVLLSYHPLLQEQLFNFIVEHIPDCPRCSHMFVLISDGKKGAARRVCSNLNKFKPIPSLNAYIHTGCENHVDGNHLYCSSCAVELQASESRGDALPGQVRVLEMRAVVTDESQEVQCLVAFEEGAPQLLPRKSVRPDLILAFETTRRSKGKYRKRVYTFPNRRKPSKVQKRRSPQEASDAILITNVGVQGLQPAVPAGKTSSFAAPDNVATGSSSSSSASPPPPPPHPVPRQPRARHITKEKHVKRYGISPGCHGCLLQVGHTDSCRERMEVAMAADPEMQDDYEKYHNRWLAYMESVEIKDELPRQERRGFARSVYC